MNLQTLVTVWLRLVSLNFLLQVFFQLIPLIFRFSEMSGHIPEDESGFQFAVPWLLEIGLIGGGILLWVFAQSLARLVTRGLPAELSFGPLSLADCYSLVFIGVGIYYLAGHFSPILNWTHYLIKMAATHSDDSWKQEIKWYDVSNAAVPFVMGIILFVNGRKWAVALAKRQTIDLSPACPPNPPSENH